MESAGTRTPVNLSTEYRRQARRLRARHHRDPARMHDNLRQLALDHDRRQTAGSTRAVTQARPRSPEAMPAAQMLGREVARRMDGPVLRYSQRLALLRLAERMGIERFEANLIIAAVQYRAGALPEPLPIPAPRRRLGVGFAAALLIEAVLLTSACALFAGLF